MITIFLVKVTPKYCVLILQHVNDFFLVLVFHIVELHNIFGFLLEPELVELVEQVAWKIQKKKLEMLHQCVNLKGNWTRMQPG